MQLTDGEQSHAETTPPHHDESGEELEQARHTGGREWHVELQEYKPDPFRIPPRGYEPLFDEISIGSDRRLVITNAFLEHAPRKKAAAFELHHMLGRASLRDPAVALHLQQQMETVLNRFPLALRNFLLSDPETKAVDDVGWFLVSEAVGLQALQDDTIIKRGSPLFSTYRQQNAEAIRRIRHMLGYFVY